MSSAEERIATKSQALDRRRQSIGQQRFALRENALQCCRRPSTLGIAAVSGFVLARLLPPLLRSHHTQHPRRPVGLLDPYLQMIPVLVFEHLRQALLRRTQTLNHRQSTENNHNVPESR